jgi:hypothetical protein
MAWIFLLSRFEAEARNTSSIRYRGDMYLQAHDAIRPMKDAIRADQVLQMVGEKNGVRLKMHPPVYALLELRVWEESPGKHKVDCVVSDDALVAGHHLADRLAHGLSPVERLLSTELFAEEPEEDTVQRTGQSGGCCNPDDL